MLEALKKAFGTKPDEKLEQEAPAVEMAANMSLEEQLIMAQDMIGSYEENMAELQQTILGLNTKTEEMANEIEGYKSQLEALQSFAAEAEAAAKVAAEEMKAKELADKKAQLAEVIGEANPSLDAVFATVESLEGEAFSVVLNSFKAAFAVEAASPMFNQVGVSGEAEIKAVDETGLNLKKHFKKKTK